MKIIGAGRQAEVFDIGGGKCLKLFFADCPESQALREARNTSLAWERGLSAPRCFGVERRGDRLGIVMESLTGETMLKKALENPESGAEYGYMLGIEHKKLNAASGEGFEDMTGSVVWAINATDMLTEAEKSRLCGEVESMPRGDRLVHLDFHPENVFMTGQGPRVIDWTGACSGDPLADAARTTLINEAPVYPVSATPETVKLIDSVKKAFTENYFRGYGITREDLGVWLPLIAASRLCSAPDGEKEYDYAIVREYLDK